MAEAPTVHVPPEPAADARPAVGYAMVVAAVLLFALNGTVAKVVLASGLTSLRLSEIRSTGALLGLTLLVLLSRPHTLRFDRRELPFFVVFGIGGVGFVQLFYFLAIHRLEIGIALLIQYLAPLLIALWARFGAHQPVRRRIWAALALALAGLTLVVEAWRGIALDRLGVVFSLIAAGTYALYLILADHALDRERPQRRTLISRLRPDDLPARDSFSLLVYGFLLASLFWACAQPWWTFPAGVVGRDVSLLGRLEELELPVWALTCSVVVLGTIVPFLLVVGALRHLSPTRVSIVAMLEPVSGAIVAYAWLGESLGTVQLVGGSVVLGAIFLAQTAR